MQQDKEAYARSSEPYGNLPLAVGCHLKQDANPLLTAARGFIINSRTTTSMRTIEQVGTTRPQAIAKRGSGSGWAQAQRQSATIGRTIILMKEWLQNVVVCTTLNKTAMP